MPTLAATTLDDKYLAIAGRVFLTSTQALVRLTLAQRRRDRTAGLDTRGFVSGYRGSPLGAVDQAFDAAGAIAVSEDVTFRPGVNEDLAATAIAGTQQVNVLERANCDGVFAMWYGKGPGVDRSGDAFRHGNLAGSAKCGGVVLCLGDDHVCKSSSTSHQSTYATVDAMIPELNPAAVAEIVPFGLRRALPAHEDLNPAMVTRPPHCSRPRSPRFAKASSCCGRPAKRPLASSPNYGRFHRPLTAASDPIVRDHFATSTILLAVRSRTAQRDAPSTSIARVGSWLLEPLTASVVTPTL